MPEISPAFLEASDIGRYRVRPFRPYNPATPEQVAGFLKAIKESEWTPNTLYLAERLSKMDPLERLNTSVKSVMFRLYETDGECPEPALAAEEQAFLEEIWYSHLPRTCKDTATQLLCVKERYVLTRIFRGAAQQLSPLEARYER